MLRPGTPAPEIDLPDQNGRRFLLSSLRGERNAVVFFYPTDDTPVCTTEACGFRDSYAQFQGRATEVIGISVQGPASHQRFAERWGLPFTLLADEQHRAHKAYAVGSFLGLFRNRVTYVIDRQGFIRAVIRSMLDGERHVREALSALTRLDVPGQSDRNQ